VSPATDEHEHAVALLVDQVVGQLQLPGCVRAHSLAWNVPGGSGYVKVPDLAVVSPRFTRVAALHLDPPPLLVVEVGVSAHASCRPESQAGGLSPRRGGVVPARRPAGPVKGHRRHL
jgi:Uma2 family endonuclease